jgi:hypothetical protein
MSDFILEILEPTINYLDVSTSFIENVNNIEIERSENFNLEIINTEKILWSDLPDNIPISKISGNLHYTRIDGLGSYVSGIMISGINSVHVDDLIWGIDSVGLDGYLDQYSFDCGIPNPSLSISGELVE